MTIGNPRNVISGPATVLIDPTNKGDFLTAPIDIGATTPDGVKSLMESDIPGYEIDQINIHVGHTLNTLQPMIEFGLAEVTLANMGYFIPGAVISGSGVEVGDPASGAALQQFSALIQGPGPGNRYVTIFIPNARPMGSPSTAYQRENIRSMPVQIGGLLPDDEQHDVIQSGDFSAATGWTFGAGWAHDAGAEEADCTGNGTMTQEVEVVKGMQYILRFDIVNYTDGSLGVDVNGGTFFPTGVVADGSYEVRGVPLQAGANPPLITFTSTGVTTGFSVDNVKLFPALAYNLTIHSAASLIA